MPFLFENKRINTNIKTGKLFQIHGMTDYYLEVTFRYHAKVWCGAIPINSKYQGIDIPYTDEDVTNWTIHCYIELDPAKNSVWQEQQNAYWNNKEAYATKSVFDALNGSEQTTRWMCRKCGPVPKCNPQPAARIKALKQDGYFIATIKQQCPTCGGKQFFDLLIRLPRHAADNEKRNAISIKLQNRIKEVLPLKDVCFNTPLTPSEAVIDHKFPSSRWVNGESINELTMSEENIKNKFQILSNQTNLQKERYCKRCVLSGQRGDFFGINWYYEGNEKWNGSSKADEKGCIGCCWYDMAKWKTKFNDHLKNKTIVTEIEKKGGSDK